MALTVGQRAPEFELPGIDGTSGEEITVSLRSKLELPVVLAFYPADDSPVCSRQLDAYTNGIANLGQSPLNLLAISPQNIESHRTFAQGHGGFGFPLLCDVDLSVARDYGVLGLMNLYRRCIVVIDPNGIVTYVHRSIGPGITYQSFDRILTAALSASAPGSS